MEKLPVAFFYNLVYRSGKAGRRFFVLGACLFDSVIIAFGARCAVLKGGQTQNDQWLLQKYGSGEGPIRLKEVRSIIHVLIPRTNAETSVKEIRQ